MSDDHASPVAKWPSSIAPGQIGAEFHATDLFEAKSATRSPERLICPSCHHAVATGNFQSGSVHCENCGNSFRLERVWPGSTIDEIRIVGRFQLLDRVGQGSFGTVWRARDTQLDRVVAVKIPHQHAIESGLDAERLEREARIAAQLRHTGIVRLYEMLKVDGLPILVSDFIEGITLKELLKIRRLTFRESARLVAQIADALDHAHERGLVHRDIKPANIMMEYSGEPAEAAESAGEPAGSAKSAGEPADERSLTRLGTPIVVDFGLALRPEADIVMTIDGQIVGTPAYMSPEQAAGRAHHVDRRSDIYNLGAVLYQLLCGELPFRGSRVMLIHQLLHEDPRPPRRLNDRIPRDLDTICMKAIAKLPSRRYTTALEMAADLRRYLRGEPCRARPVGRLERGWLWARRNRGLAGASGLAAALLLVGAAGALWFAVREKNHADALKVALDQSQQHLGESRYHLAENYLDRGLSLCERGEVAHGMLLLARSASAVPEAAEDLGRVVRANLAGWQEKLDPLLALRAHGTAIAAAHLSPAVAFSSDGKLAATGAADRKVLLWSGADARLLGGPIDCSSEVRSLVFSPDSQTLAITCLDGKARLWDGRHGCFVPTIFDRLQRIYSIAYSHDGKTLATGGEDGQLKFWDAALGRQLSLVLAHDRPIVMVAFAPDDKAILTATNDGKLQLWNPRTGAKLGQAAVPNYMTAALSPDGRWLATGSGDGLARIWDASSLSLLRSLAHTSLVFAVAFSPDGQTLLTGTADKIARLWDVRSGENIGPAAYHPQPVKAVAISPDGSRILTCSDDGVCQLHRRTSVKTHCLEIPHRAAVDVVGISPDGRIALSGTKPFDRTEGEVQFWDLFTGRALGRLAHLSMVTAAVFSPDGRTVATGSADQTAMLVDVATGKMLCPPLRHQGWVHAVAFNPEGNRLLTACEDGIARLWEVPTGRFLDRRFTHELAVVALAFSPDGTLALTASSDQTAKLWNIASGRELHVFRHQGFVRNIAFSPDGTAVLTASLDRTVRIWRVDSGLPLGKPLVHQDEVLCAAFSPDGQTVVTGSKDQTAQLWQVATTNPLGPPLVHQGPIYAAAYSPDGLAVATASGDATVRLWDVATCRPLGPALRHHGWVTALEFSPDGRRLITGGRDKTAHIWELPANLAASPRRLAVWVQTLCGMEVRGNEALGLLTPEDWQNRCQELQELGGPPIAER